MLAPKVEESKVPKFYSQRGKDTILALNFIHQIYDLTQTQTNTWNDTVTYSNFVTTKWLLLMVYYLDYSDDTLTCTNLKPRFQKQYMVQTND
jgi:hypothetical protein